MVGDGISCCWYQSTRRGLETACLTGLFVGQLHLECLNVNRPLRRASSLVPAAHCTACPPAQVNILLQHRKSSNDQYPPQLIGISPSNDSIRKKLNAGTQNTCSEIQIQNLGAGAYPPLSLPYLTPPPLPQATQFTLFTTPRHATCNRESRMTKLNPTRSWCGRTEKVRHQEEMEMGAERRWGPSMHARCAGKTGTPFLPRLLAGGCGGRVCNVCTPSSWDSPGSAAT